MLNKHALTITLLLTRGIVLGPPRRVVATYLSIWQQIVKTNNKYHNIYFAQLFTIDISWHNIHNTFELQSMHTY